MQVQQVVEEGLYVDCCQIVVGGIDVCLCDLYEEQFLEVYQFEDGYYY